MLYVSEIFLSIQGESSMSGLPCVFIRLSGCNLRCRFCDTRGALKICAGNPVPVRQIPGMIKHFPCRYVCVTGGEPLMQAKTRLLLGKLLSAGYRVSLETNGSMDITSLPRKVHIVMDIKCPSSGYSRSNRYANLSSIKPSDDIKFVIGSRKDYEWTKRVISARNIASKTPNILLSPADGRIKPRTLAAWMLKDGIPARMQLQLHKILNLK